MTDETARLRLPLIAASQAQKHITHNDALVFLDTLVQASVIAVGTTAPPGSPAEGDQYAVGASATGAWTGWDQRIARYQDGAWTSFLPATGWTIHNQGDDSIYRYKSAAWSQLPPTLPSYTVAGVPSASANARKLIYVSNESGGAVPAFSDGTNWRRVTDRNVIS